MLALKGSRYAPVVSKPKNINIKLCIIYQNVRDFNQNTKPYKPTRGKRRSSRSFSDCTSYRLNKTDLNKIQYHIKTCYVRYKKDGEREMKRKHRESTYTQTLSHVNKWQLMRGSKKRKKTVDTRAQEINNVLLIWNQIKHKG